MEAVKYKLKDPIRFGTETITELSFQPLKQKHLRGTKGNWEVDDTALIVSRLAGLSSDEVGELSVRDWVAVTGIVADFLQLSPETTKA